MVYFYPNNARIKSDGHGCRYDFEHPTDMARGIGVDFENGL